VKSTKHKASAKAKSTTGAKGAKSPAKKATVKKSTPVAKTAVKKPVAKKAVAVKKPAVTAKKPAAKKPVTKKPTAKKPTAQKTTAKKAVAAKKPIVKKPVAKKAVAVKKPAAVKKPVAKKPAPAKKAVSKKPSPATPKSSPKTAASSAKKVVPVKKVVPAKKAVSSKSTAAPQGKVSKTAVKTNPLPLKPTPAKTATPSVTSATKTPPAKPAAPTADTTKKSPRAAKAMAMMPPPPGQSVASTTAKSSYGPIAVSSLPAVVPVLPVKDPKLVDNWKSKTAETISDAEIIAMPDDEYMNSLQMAFFRHKLVQLKNDILVNAGETTEHLREDTVIVPDPADRATIEEEHALELRTRDRERKLLKKIEQSIARIDSGDYGYCDETGEPIGVGRLIARPTATLSLEAQQRRELKQKMFGD
jgi:DnaK suppressor protein